MAAHGDQPLVSDVGGERVKLHCDSLESNHEIDPTNESFLVCYGNFMY